MTIATVPLQNREHGDVQLDLICQEFLVQLLNWDIEPERKERMQPEF